MHEVLYIYNRHAKILQDHILCFSCRTRRYVTCVSLPYKSAIWYSRQTKHCLANIDYYEQTFL